MEACQELIVRSVLIAAPPAGAVRRPATAGGPSWYCVTPAAREPSWRARAGSRIGC